MKMKVLPLKIKICACFLAVLMLALCCSSCASKGKALITLDKDGYKVSFSVNHYELLLSRWKGALVSSNATNNGYNAEQNEFYDTKDKFNGTDLQTLAEYYSDMILENSRTYTAVLWLFDSMQLSLSDDQVNSVNQRMNDILEIYGTKTKLNALLGTYGVNYELLREMYSMEEKITTVQNALYGSEGSLLGPEVKEQFLAENYVRFKQIFLPYFKYVYKTDKNGDEIYYLKESTTAKIAYDTVNGYEGIKADGTPDYDSNGDLIYYTSQENQTRIAYNKDETVSTRSYVLDSDGNAKTEEMTKEEIEAVAEQGKELFKSLQGCSVAEFEAAMEQHNDDGGEEVYTDGYYLQKNIDYAAVSDEFAYFSDIVNESDSLNAGDIVAITSDSAGYHIIMKFDSTPQAYENAVNEVWFKNFTSDLISELFWEECESLFDDMVINEKIWAKASDIKQIGVNTDF